MGPDRDQTRDPWISSQTRICCQPRYQLRYAARYRAQDEKLKGCWIVAHRQQSGKKTNRGQLAQCPLKFELGP